MPEDATLEVASLRGIRCTTPTSKPRHPGDGEPAEGAIIAADGVLLATPNTTTASLGVQERIDWLSRPSSDIRRVFGGRPFAIIGASPGGFGTTLSQAAWLPVMRTLGTQTWFGGRLMCRAPAACSMREGA